MATANKNLSSYNQTELINASSYKFGIVVAEWNSDITEALLLGAIETLRKHGVGDKNILIKHVPGSFELTLGAQFLAEYSEVDAIICLGCVIQGETPHFDYICQSVSQGVTNLNIAFNLPFVFGVLTTNNIKQAQERAGGKHGNKGVEAAVTAIKMVQLQSDLIDETLT